MAKPRTVHTNIRLHWLAKELVRREARRTGESESAVINRAVLEVFSGPEADALIVEFAREDPTLGPLLKALQRAAQRAHDPGTQRGK